MPNREARLSGIVAGLGGNVDAPLDELPVAAAVSDRDGIIRWQNARWAELAGDCIGRPIAEYVAPESTHEWRREFTKKVIGSARTSDYELTMLAPDGSRVPIEVSSVVIEGTDDRVVGIFGMIEPADRPSRSASPPLHLTPRQLEVLQLLCQGSSTVQISRRLRIETETVRNHVRGILRALGVHSRLEAVAAARRSGIFVD